MPASATVAAPRSASRTHKPRDALAGAAPTMAATRHAEPEVASALAHAAIFQEPRSGAATGCDAKGAAGASAGWVRTPNAAHFPLSVSFGPRLLTRAGASVR